MLLVSGLQFGTEKEVDLFDNRASIVRLRVSILNHFV